MAAIGDASRCKGDPFSGRGDNLAYRAQNARIISAETAAIFRGILKTVTEEGGTATEAAVEGNEVAGKTGTAQLFDQQTRHYSKTIYRFLCGVRTGG